MRKFAIILGTSFVLAATSVFADSTMTPPAAPADAPAAKQSSTDNSSSGTADTKKTADDEAICKRLDPATGSRLGTREICKTKAQWDTIQQEAQKDVNTIQHVSGQAGYSFAGGMGH